MKTDYFIAFLIVILPAVAIGILWPSNLPLWLGTAISGAISCSFLFYYFRNPVKKKKESHKQ